MHKNSQNSTGNVILQYMKELGKVLGLPLLHVRTKTALYRQITRVLCVPTNYKITGSTYQSRTCIHYWLTACLGRSFAICSKAFMKLKKCHL
ncbi:hypothetical protein NQ318_005911 [Aromia moschata]|uniref:Uncharacterized protein n=1 Tax=Aromia moschata TaxID=1265417 RepID=A0AAV8XHV3_9CUCU|nr:hypothetical protein NQ318_005911 [Aromia moschata]